MSVVRSRPTVGLDRVNAYPLDGFDSAAGCFRVYHAVESGSAARLARRRLWPITSCGRAWASQQGSSSPYLSKSFQQFEDQVLNPVRIEKPTGDRSRQSAAHCAMSRSNSSFSLGAVAGFGPTVGPPSTRQKAFKSCWKT